MSLVLLETFLFAQIIDKHFLNNRDTNYYGKRGEVFLSQSFLLEQRYFYSGLEGKRDMLNCTMVKEVNQQ